MKCKRMQLISKEVETVKIPLNIYASSNITNVNTIILSSIECQYSSRK